ncbi:MAG: LysE family transporter [Cyclobacteriaceae bacterium]
MSHSLAVLSIGLVVSYLGSIPPGTLNLTVIQLGIKEQHSAALNFAFASALVEFFYAGIAVKAQLYLTSNPAISGYFQLVTGCLLLVIGLINLLYRRKGRADTSKDVSAKGGFWRGFVLSSLNPMAIPFWLAVTAALQSAEWLLITNQNLIFYLLGISSGTFILLLQASRLGIRLKHLQENSFLMYRLPGIILISLSAYTFYVWLL